jgi:LAS superfamily LD-carboxypeptidase LdcB
MPHVRKYCLYIAFDSAHETGLAVDFGSHGLYPNTRTIARQRKTPLYAWLVEEGERYGWTNYDKEPWHWEHIIPKHLWDLPGPEDV